MDTCPHLYPQKQMSIRDLCPICQRAEIGRLRAALQKIAEWPGGQVYSAGYSPDDAQEMMDVAQDALKPRRKPKQ